MSKTPVFLLLLFSLTPFMCRPESTEKIDRQALVTRHFPTLKEIDPLSPFTVGNGEFAFTADVTGLQTLAEAYENGIPLLTQSQWGWHSVPDTNNYCVEQTWQFFDTYGRQVPYAATMNSDAAQYLRANPHRLNLARIGFKSAPAFEPVNPAEITVIDQVLDIWQGVLKSAFTFNGQKIKVETCVHPSLDQVAVRFQSADLATTGLGIGFEFPYGSLDWGKSASDWTGPERHTSNITAQGENFVTIERQLDSAIYFVDIQWQGNVRFEKIASHAFFLEMTGGEVFEFTCRFSQKQVTAKDDAATTFELSKQLWQNFWLSGGAVDLSKCTDPRAQELERRIVLSQYLTAIQCAGSLPPQETGLTANSWFGKFHLEMHWWHAAHFVLWGRPALLEKSLPWYNAVLPAARAKAEIQGYAGVRWSKMAAPDGQSSPSNVGELLIWQQPHPIYFAELLYRHYQSPDILKRYQEIVFQTADFMASYAHWDEANERYVLGPPLIPAQEIYPPEKTINPAFELSYWAFGFKTAQKWRLRLGLEPNEKWQHVLDHLADLPAHNGFYQNAENALDTFENEFNRNDHPTLLGAYGMLPNDNVDVAMMRRTLEEVIKTWNWLRTWGWDYPLVAMTAARIGRPDLAIDALLMETPKNTWLNNGHNYQADRLPLYLPGNGGLLAAIAMMAAGWDGAQDTPAPGFPQDGCWVVEYEGLERMP